MKHITGTKLVDASTRHGILRGLIVGSRATFVVWAVATLLLLALLFDRLADPPFWDAAWSTSAGAAELSRNGFNYGAVLSAPPFDQEGPGSHASSLLTPILAVFFVLFGSPGGLIAGHLLMVGVGGALVAATFALARRYLSPVIATVVAALALILPLMVQQVADPYIDLPLALLTILTVLAALDGKRGRAVLFAALAIWFKPTGIMLVPVIAMMGERGGLRRRVKNALAAVIAALPLAIHIAARAAAAHARPDTSIDTTLFLLRNALVTIGATTDVLLIATLFVVAVFRQRRMATDFVRVAVTISLGFFGIMIFTMVFSQGVTILPRYYVAVLPLWMVLVAVDLSRVHSTRVATWFFAILIFFSLLNWNGHLYPLPDHPHPVMAERTPGGAKEYLELEIAGARALAESAESVETLILEGAMHFRFQYPELGFLSNVPDDLTSSRDLRDPPTRSFAWVQEPHVTTETLTPAEVAEKRGWTVERTAVWRGRWDSDLVISR